MKRRIIALATVTVLTLALSACGASEESNNSTPTVEQSSQTVTVEPTEVPEVTPTEALETTPEPTEVPEEPVVNPADVPEDPNFAKIKEMASGYDSRYNDYVTIIETMDESRYVVTAVDNLDLVLADGLTDAEKAENVSKFLALPWFSNYTEENSRHPWSTVPTGEYYVMTLTDLVTNETVVWGFRVHLENTEKSGTYYVAEEGTYLLFHMYFGSVQLNTTYATEIYRQYYGEEPESTENPEITEAPVEPTEAPTEPAGNPENPDFAKVKEMVADMYMSSMYSDLTAVIETMDESRYVVTAVDNLDLLLRAGLTDAEREDNKTLFLNSKFFSEVYDMTLGEPIAQVVPTGEYYVMTLTDTVTDETIVWGFRVHAEDKNNAGTYYVLEWGIGCIGMINEGNDTNLALNETFAQLVMEYTGDWDDWYKYDDFGNLVFKFQ